MKPFSRDIILSMNILITEKLAHLNFEQVLQHFQKMYLLNIIYSKKRSVFISKNRSLYRHTATGYLFLN